MRSSFLENRRFYENVLLSEVILSNVDCINKSSWFIPAIFPSPEIFFWIHGRGVISLICCFPWPFSYSRLLVANCRVLCEGLESLTGLVFPLNPLSFCQHSPRERLSFLPFFRALYFVINVAKKRAKPVINNGHHQAAYVHICIYIHMHIYTYEHIIYIYIIIDLY